MHYYRVIYCALLEKNLYNMPLVYFLLAARLLLLSLNISVCVMEDSSDNMRHVRVLLLRIF